MTDPKTKIKILWPDGPRWVDEDYVISAAHDALCDEWLDMRNKAVKFSMDEFGVEPTFIKDIPDDLSTVIPKPSLEEAIEIVNDRGILTTSTCQGPDDYCGESEDWDDDLGPDESMDGDHQSALASCGWGDDEDYGSYGGEDY